MMEWILSNIWTIVLSLALLTAVTLITIKMVADRKKGKSSCGCDCGCCNMKEGCSKTDKSIN